MSTVQDPIAAIQAELRAFARERDWEQYHTPRNLAALIASEAGELLALYRWGESPAHGDMDAVRDEVADVFLAVLRFADVTGIDLPAVGRAKIERNADRYPVGRSLPDPVDR